MFSRFARYWIERKIKIALESNDLDDLLLWLSVAYGSTVFDQACLDYTFSVKDKGKDKSKSKKSQSLFDYAITTSNELLNRYKSPLSFFEKLMPTRYQQERRRRFYLLAQSSLTIISKITLYQPQSSKPLEFGFWKRFLSNRYNAGKNSKKKIVQTIESEKDKKDQKKDYFASFIKKVKAKGGFKSIPKSPLTKKIH